MAARGRASALARLVARRRLVDDVDAALAANHAVVAMTAPEGLERVLYLHWSCPSQRPAPGRMLKARQKARPMSAWLLDEAGRRCQGEGVRQGSPIDLKSGRTRPSFHPDVGLPGFGQACPPGSSAPPSRSEIDEISKRRADRCEGCCGEASARRGQQEASPAGASTENRSFGETNPHRGTLGCRCTGT
jgi:hypothetical protein